MIVANALWAAGSVAVVVAGGFTLTGAGTAWVLLQAAVVAGFAGRPAHRPPPSLTHPPRRRSP